MKFQAIEKYAGISRSLPSRERGLKLQRSVWNGLFHLSLPSRERGLEFS